jgi:hypothetical protein
MVAALTVAVVTAVLAAAYRAATFENWLWLKTFLGGR